MRRPAEVELTPALVRRLAIARQSLAGPLPCDPAAAVEPLVAHLGCLQLDPISVVARSHMLVLWSRLGPVSEEVVDSLLYERRRLFEYWAHQASIVPVGDYALHEATLMRGYGRGGGPWDRRVRAWLEAHDELRRHVLGELSLRAPLVSREIADPAPGAADGENWPGTRNVRHLLEQLWLQGVVAVAGRRGRERVWELAERWLPTAQAGPRLALEEAVREAAQRSLRALGAATPAQIRRHFLRGRYPGLEAALASLERDGQVLPAVVHGAGPGPWYLHADDLPLVERLAAGEWQGRSAALSPFDNLLCDRERTERLFGFRYRIEIYVPAAQRRHGYYVLPILHGDALIGRVDAALDRRRGLLVARRVHAEPGAPRDAATGRAVAAALARLAHAAGARGVELVEAAPRGWGRALRRSRSAAA